MMFASIISLNSQDLERNDHLTYRVQVNDYYDERVPFFYSRVRKECVLLMMPIYTCN